MKKIVTVGKIMKRLICLMAGCALPLLGYPKDAVVIVPAHPDDLISMLGFCHLARNVYEIHVVDFTHGERGLGFANLTNGVAFATRQKEEEAVCASVGAKLHWLDEVDGEAHASRDTCAKLAEIIRALKPRAVFAHWPVDIHTDHVMAGAAALRATFLSETKPEVWFFDEAYQSRGFVPDVLVDVSSVNGKIYDSMRLYACQNGGDCLEKEQRLAKRFRGMQSRDYYKGHAEGYKAMMPFQQGVGSVFDGLPRSANVSAGFDFEGAFNSPWGRK